MSSQDFHDAPQPKQGMSSTAKVLLILGSIGGLALLVCCGVGAFVVYRFKDSVSVATTPAAVRQQTQEIMQVEVPDEFPPMMGMKFKFGPVDMRYAIYGTQGNDASMLLIMEMKSMPGQGQGDARQMRDQMLQGMRQNQQQHGQQMVNVVEESSESRDFTINGQKVPFEFIKGKNAVDGTAYRQVVGVIPSGDGFIMIMLTTPESQYDEDKVVKMIESIHLTGVPEGAAAPAVNQATETPQAEKPTDDEGDADATE